MNAPDGFVNYDEIILSADEKPVMVDSESLEWAQQVIHQLHLEPLNTCEKAQKICTYVHQHFRYTFAHRHNLREIITKKGGNCVSHTLLGLLLLRLAGIPAKLAHEVHITKPYRLISLVVGRWAKKHHDGINSYWHNDHVWVWFRHHETWEPFDSALHVCGFGAFYAKRFVHHRTLSTGFAQKWTGPPFVIWEGRGQGFTGMQNITSRILHADSLQECSQKEAWLEFIALFRDWAQEDFHAAYLPAPLLQRVREASTQWFARQ